MKRLIPFIAAVAVIFSALQLDIFAVDPVMIKYATTIYGSTAVNSHGFLIDSENVSAQLYTRTNINTGSYVYIGDRYKVSGVTGNNTRMIILNNDTDNSAHVMGVSRRLGDTSLRFMCQWYYTDGFFIGFTTYSLDISPEDFEEGSLDRAVAEIYVYAQSHDQHPDVSKICLSVNNVTKFDTAAVSSGRFGQVYQGVATSSGKLLSSDVTQYYYNATDLTIMWTLNTTWKGITVDDSYWRLFKLNREMSYIPRANGVTGQGYSIGYQNTNDIDYYSLTLTGLYYLNDDTALNTFITDLLFMLFDVDGENVSEFDSTRYIWCVPASIDQDQQQDIIDQQDVIVDKLDNIYEAIVGGDETAPSSPSEEQLVNMIDKTALENARVQINAFDVSAYASAVSAILYINTAWANYPVFTSAIILVGVGFLIFTIINGLKKK